MNVLRLLLVEDNEQERDLCKETATRYKSDKQCEVKIVECKCLDEAFEKLDNSFDAAIIDLKLENGGEGNQVLRRIAESSFRIPVAILTGTPDAVDADFDYIGVFKKGDKGAGYEDLLTHFWGIYNTGLTRIMGGRGIIEDTLNKVFKESLIPYRKKWISYGEKDSSRTEKALLRHALNHLFQLLDDDEKRVYPEEVYLAPPHFIDRIQTGRIVKNRETDNMFVVMNPACDLVVRGEGKTKTEQILLVGIDSCKTVFPDHPVSTSDLDKKQQGDLKTAFSNKKSPYYHWLPETDFFKGGFLNFRKICTLDALLCEEQYEKTFIQIAPSFIKDMVARFSAYYARQGQPDIDFTLYFNSQENKC